VRYKVVFKETYYQKKPAVSKRIVICPIVLIALKDFLSTFPKAFCYKKQDQMFIANIQGSTSNIWLNRSKVTKKLSYIKITKVSKKSNVYLV
jgi:hypothetical protein